jgi:EF hand
MWRKMIDEADIDGDGEISLDEFEKLMTTLLYNHNQYINKQQEAMKKHLQRQLTKNANFLKQMSLVKPAQ